MRDKIRKIIPIAGLAGLIILFSLTTGGKFFTLQNAKNIVMQASIALVAAVGTVFVMAHNNLDFSLGGACALSSVLAYLCSGGNLWLFILLAIVFGVLCGLFTSVIHIYGRVPAFMGGLCLMFAGRGVAQTATASQYMMIAESGQLNNFWVFLAVAVTVFGIGYFLFNYTKIGKYQKLIGTNPRATELSGISVNKYKTIAFVISGVTLGIAATLTLSRSLAVTGNTGLNLETDVLLALSLGGISMAGGSATRIRSAVIGVLTYYILNNGMLLWGMNPDYVDIVKAVFFLATVSISIDRSEYELIA
ncbi:MAG: ABC transporter permease [Clostridia bacterium]|nr:ABC transporter permease [Clostridia bacterium]MBR4658958.1 ABC transporter permease [Clostridia bacterium]